MTMNKNNTLRPQRYLKYPFRMTRQGGATSSREEHIRGKIEQILFTAPTERVFRPDWGLGARALIFEPNTDELRKMALNRLYSGLAEALQKDVDAKSLDISFKTPEGAPEKLQISISYTLATIKKAQTIVLTGNAESTG